MALREGIIAIIDKYTKLGNPVLSSDTENKFIKELTLELFKGLPSYGSNAAAVSGGLEVGDPYIKTGTGAGTIYVVV